MRPVFTTGKKSDEIWGHKEIYPNPHSLTPHLSLTP